MRSALTLCLIAACWGDGPTPSLPESAEILFRVDGTPDPGQCNASYVGDVVVSGSSGFAITLPYTPPSDGDSCTNGGNGTPTPVPVHQFPKSPGANMMVGDAGTHPTNGGTDKPRIAVSGTTPYWFYAKSMSAPNTLFIGPSAMSINLSNGTPFAVGAVADTSHIYVAIMMLMGGGYSVDINHPAYPGTGMNQAVAGTYTFYRIAVPGGLSGALSKLVGYEFAWQTMANPLAQNATDLFFAASAAGESMVKIWRWGKNDLTSPTEIGSIQGLVPVGLAADATRVVWAAGPHWVPMSVPSPHCVITEYVLATGQRNNLLDTTKFSCMDVTINDTHAYFAIVGPSEGYNKEMRGLGYGRVTLDGEKTIESIEHGMVGYAVGPRRVYVDEELYVIDPFTVARIPRAVFDGRSDFPY